MSIKLAVPEQNMITLKPRISVIGVGGGGGNAVNNMITKNLEGVDFIVANTDAQALANSKSGRKIQLGTETTRGLGAGADPSVGKMAAEEATQEIERELEGANMVFITAGMGGGTGSGAAPVVAKIAKEKGILTIGVITKPFQFEGKKRSQIADAAVNEFGASVDSMIVIPNQNLFRVADKSTTLADAFIMADNVLYSGVRSITDLMMMPGLINLDFADIKSIMEDKGRAIMGTGEAEGEDRAVRAAEQALSNPLLDDSNMKGARGVLINITGGMDITLFEVDEAANRIKQEVDEDAQIIFGSSFDEGLNGKIRVSIVATGIQNLGSPFVTRDTNIARAKPLNTPQPATDYIAESFGNESLIVTAKEEPKPEPVETVKSFIDDYEIGDVVSNDETPIIPDDDEFFDTNPTEEAIASDTTQTPYSEEISDIPQASSLFLSIINKQEPHDVDTQLENILANSERSFSPKGTTRTVEEEPELFSHAPQIFAPQKEDSEKLIVPEEEEYTPTLIERVTGFSIAKRNRKKKPETDSYQEPTIPSFGDNNDETNLDIPSFLRRK